MKRVLIATLALLPGIVTSGKAQFSGFASEAVQQTSIENTGLLSSFTGDGTGDWVIDQTYLDGAEGVPFFPNELIVEPPTDPGDLGAYCLFIQQVEGVYKISIHTDNINPSGVVPKVIERHYWNEELEPWVTLEIRDLYRSAGYRAYLSHAYSVFQLSMGDGEEMPFRWSSGDDWRIDPLMVGQIPYPFGDDDAMGYTENEGGYLRARYAVWPPEESARGDVLLVLSDTGLYWRYEDFITNLWQNPGEDLNDNGTIVKYGSGSYEFDPADLNGRDDDGNGYEDLIGYNFYDGSPDPTHHDGEFFTHGTTVYSVVGSETYNGIDMAGVLFPGYVKVVPTKVGYGVVINEAAAIEGIYYASCLQAQGHQVVLNMSWGGEYESEPLQYALSMFTDFGGLAIAATGNEPDGRERYPAAWPNVLAVSASTMLNDRAYFSNFGFWVDIAAPGEEILAAYYFASGEFDEMFFAPLEGTSFAAPMVSSLAAMYWATKPELSAADLKEHLLSAVYTPEDYPWDPPHTWPKGILLIGPPDEDFGDPYYGVGILDGYLLFES